MKEGKKGKRKNDKQTCLSGGGYGMFQPSFYSLFDHLLGERNS
jgi:hypothetical protein